MNFDAVTLTPVAALAAAALAVMLAGAFVPRPRLLWGMALAGEAAAFGGLLWICTRPMGGTGMLDYTFPTLFFTGMLLMAGLAVTLVSRSYLATRPVHGELHHREFYILLLLLLAGAVILVASRHFALLFLGLELLSVSLFGLVAYTAQERRSLEAGMKYLLLSGSSSALLLFGLALIYAATGSLAFNGAAAPGSEGLARAGLLLGTVGFAFKLSLVPFHMWTPDVFEGAPAPVTALLAGVSKGAVAIAFWQWLALSPLGSDKTLLAALALLAVFSMLVGNVLGLFQRNLKRLLAYSSIGHMGFWLVPIAVAGPTAAEAMGYYLAAYVASVLAAFVTISLLSGGGDGDSADVVRYRGLFTREPLAAVVLATALLSLAGIPLTVGFIAKFYVFVAGVEGDRWGLLGVVVVSSAVGIYYYLRVITVFFTAGDSEEVEPTGLGRGVLLFLLLFIVFYGIVPAPLMDAVRTVMAR
jgi:NADH-quinone oxidoreductase subunit N